MDHTEEGGIKIDDIIRKGLQMNQNDTLLVEQILSRDQILNFFNLYP